jgi:hypothetical protein
MNLKAALLATATASAFLLVAACGGGPIEIGVPSQPNASATSGENPNNTSQARGIGAVCGTVLGSGSGSSRGSNASAQYVAIDLHSSGYSYTQATGIAGGQQVGRSYSSIENPGVHHALLWQGSASSIVDLHPHGFTYSFALATNGTIQVGSGSAPGKGWHALKWSGSADSVVDLDPDSPVTSEARAIAGDQIVGYGRSHALMWTSGGVVDLNPNGFVYSEAFATDGTHQAGTGIPSGGHLHALLWSGTAESAIDLHPAGCSGSYALGVGGGQQVGYAWLSDSSYQTHALLWTGSAESVVDLHPGGFYDTRALAVAAGRQVGYGEVMGGYHALLWNGTADSVVDLHAFLPPGFFSSQALGVDASGNVIGEANPSQGCPGGCAHAILWVRQ